MSKIDSLELVDEARDILQNISVNIDESISKPKIKSILEHLRSSLEYAASDLNTTLKQSKIKRVFFPYGKSEEDFNNSIKKHFPTLALENPIVLECIYRHQDFVSDSPWLNLMCDLTNQVKHREPIHTEHRRSSDLAFGTPDFNLVVIKGIDPKLVTINCSNNRVGEQYLDDFSYSNEVYELNQSRDLRVDFEIINNNKILINGTATELLPFLENCIQNVDLLVKEIYQNLN